MGAAVIILILVIIVIILVAIGWLSLGFNVQFAKGQFAPNNTKQTAPAKVVPLPPVVTPTPVPTATPTTPNPNFQYLPQKAYVQSFAPENGITSNAVPLQAIPTIIPAQQQAQPTTVGGLDLGSMAGVLGVLGAGAAYLKGHFANKKADKVEGTAKENAVAIVDSKVVEQEIAKYMFNLDKAKADALNDAPAIKLETLENKKEKATETASKA
jgi:hypothetical protein